eukprot:5481384-Amphidinium_carterae.1
MEYRPNINRDPKQQLSKTRAFGKRTQRWVHNKEISGKKQVEASLGHEAPNSNRDSGKKSHRTAANKNCSNQICTPNQ